MRDRRNYHQSPTTKLMRLFCFFESKKLPRLGG
uniref:Uncharacterized protein n=1 Tax=Rhizophora mucronata TaxID=61149 RepID=A0A2P2NCL1_RHIMU